MSVSDSQVKPLNSGWLPDPFDERDKAYYYRGEEKAKEDFQQANLWDAHEEWLTGVYDQSTSSTCVANATAAAIRYLARKHGLPGHVQDPSRLFIYYNARLSSFVAKPGRGALTAAEDIQDKGCYTRYALRGVSQYGIASEKTWPFKTQFVVHLEDPEQPTPFVTSINDRPTHAAYAEAHDARHIEYRRLDPDNAEEVNEYLSPQEMDAVGIMTLARLKQCIIEGYPVIFSFRYYSSSRSWEPKNDLDAENERFLGLPDIPTGWEHKRPSQDYKGHTVLAVGFKDTLPPGNGEKSGATGGADGATKGRVLCQNSYGVNDEEHHPSHFWMSYDWIRDYYATDDFWMIRLTHNPASNLYPKVTTPDGWKCTPLYENQDSSMAPTSNLRTITHNPGVSVTGFWWINQYGSVLFAYKDSKNSKGGSGDETWKRHKLTDQHAASLGGITALSPDTNTLEVYWIAPDGSIQGSRNISASSNPLTWEPTTAMLPANTALPKAAISALSTSPTNSLFVWISPSGSVQSASRTGAGWSSIQELSPAQSVTVHSTLTVILLDSGRVAVFWISAADGSVQCAIRLSDAAGPWTPAMAVTPPHSASAASGLACVVRKPNAVELFYVSPRGMLRQCSLDTAVQPFKWSEWPTISKGDKLAVEAIKRRFPARADSDIRTVPGENGEPLRVVWMAPDGAIRTVGGDNQNHMMDLKTLLDLPPPVSVAPASPGTPVGILYETKGRFLICYIGYNEEFYITYREETSPTS